jgi:glycosyltransferase involved in cell wall biosynthesis
MEHEPNRIKSALSRRVLNSADLFITHSHWDRDNLERWLGASRAAAIRVSPHPVYEHLSQPVLSKAEAKAELGIRAERVVLFFGFIRDYKGLRYLIESLPQVRTKLDVHLLIAGEVWGRHATEDARLAAHLIQDDPRFATGVLAIGHLVPLALLWSGVDATGVAGVLTLFGLLAWEHLYVQAPQRIPLA